MRLIWISLLAGCLSGCAGMNGDFGCNKTASDHCTPVDQVNRAANSGRFAYSHSGDALSLASVHLHASASHSAYPMLPGAPVRQSETVQRIWIAPYQDMQHNFHEPSDVYTVLQHAHWTGSPPVSLADHT